MVRDNRYQGFRPSKHVIPGGYGKRYEQLYQLNNMTDYLDIRLNSHSSQIYVPKQSLKTYYPKGLVLFGTNYTVIGSLLSPQGIVEDFLANCSTYHSLSDDKTHTECLNNNLAKLGEHIHQELEMDENLLVFSPTARYPNNFLMFFHIRQHWVSFMEITINRLRFEFNIFEKETDCPLLSDTNSQMCKTPKFFGQLSDDMLKQLVTIMDYRLSDDGNSGHILWFTIDGRPIECFANISKTDKPTDNPTTGSPIATDTTLTLSDISTENIGSANHTTTATTSTTTATNHIMTTEYTIEDQPTDHTVNIILGLIVIICLFITGAIIIVLIVIQRHRQTRRKLSNKLSANRRPSFRTSSADTTSELQSITTVNTVNSSNS
ncbi:uncharacterized protein LOC128956901 [Oppia nitens]|uniref:uncharacterized protein LOC128956901 n=1 Tax=Oppia nitens TaxID=1686743 RepID=UPI0023DAB5B1|nr:uncharacterized protein LOC128956901 [Oppia nitens]